MSALVGENVGFSDGYVAFSTCTYEIVKHHSIKFTHLLSTPMIPKTLPPLLRSCWIKLNATFQNKVSKIGLTPDQYTALRWLMELERKTITQKDLKRLMFTDANTIAALVKRMEKHGLIERSRHPFDQRKKILKATAKGRRLYQRGREIAENLEQSLLHGFSPEEKNDFIRILMKANYYFSTESTED